MSGYLLDTQIVLWAAGFPHRLAPQVRRTLERRESSSIVSSVSIAEMAIKQSIGKLALSVPPAELCEQLGVSELPLSWSHAQRVGALPLIHRDPFDRLLVAQALEEELILVTADAIIAGYPGLQVLQN